MSGRGCATARYWVTADSRNYKKRLRGPLSWKDQKIRFATDEPEKTRSSAFLKEKGGVKWLAAIKQDEYVGVDQQICRQGT